MSVPEITVAITTHNLERFIAACLDELLCQTFQDFEILVYDDCSTDRTREILTDYSGRYPDKMQILWGSVLQGSPARSRNAILNSQKITGKYLVFLDGDDNIEPDYLEKLYLTAKKTGAEITLCAYDRFEHETGHVLCQEMRGFPPEIMLPAESDILAFVNSALWNKLILTSIINQLRIPDFKVGEDLCFQLRLFKRCHKIACVDQILVHYRVHSGSIMANTQEQTMYALAEELKHIAQESEEEPWFKDTVALVAFLHIGVSMTSRAFDNPAIKESEIIRWAYKYYQSTFGPLSSSRLLRIRSLKSHGIKGYGIWAAKLSYQMHIFPVFLWTYKTATRLFKMDIKF